MGFGLNRTTGRLELGPITVPMPASKAGRIVAGSSLMACGVLGFLPVLGFWMLPVGFLVLSNELSVARRLRRRIAVRWGRRGRAKA